MTTAVVIPFRSRGNDWRREANLNRALEHWAAAGIDAHVFDDGLSGDSQFNRSACYNRAIHELDADVFIFSEADLLTPIHQVDEGIELAREPGLVVPFSRFLAMGEQDSERVRAHAISPFEASAQQVRGDRESTGAVNIVSRESIEMIGCYDESFTGAWFDDSAIEIAFRICCGPTRFVDGPGFHQFHLSNVSGEHLTEEDRAATAANQQRYELYVRATTPERIRELTSGS